jgi:hypothetical protein
MQGKLAEGAQWILTIANTINSLGDVLGKFGEGYEKLPPLLKQRLPGLLGLSLEDERLFNGVLGTLDVKDQLLIAKFLNEKCADFQRNRFILVVSGMEVSVGKPKTEERSWDKKSGKSTTKTTSGSEGLDRRKKFLESFANVIKKGKNDGSKGMDTAYKYAVGARLIFDRSVFQDTLKQLRNSGVNTAKALEENQRQNVADLTQTTTSWVDRAKAWRDRA